MASVRPPIKFVVHTVTSKADVYGNRYHYAHIYHCATGEAFTRLEDYEGHAYYTLMNELHLDHGHVLGITCVLPIRDWNRQSKAVFAVKYHGDDELLRWATTQDLMATVGA